MFATVFKHTVLVLLILGLGGLGFFIFISALEWIEDRIWGIAPTSGDTAIWIILIIAKGVAVVFATSVIYFGMVVITNIFGYTFVDGNIELWDISCVALTGLVYFMLVEVARYIEFITCKEFTTSFTVHNDLEKKEYEFDRKNNKVLLNGQWSHIFTVDGITYADLVLSPCLHGKDTDLKEFTRFQILSTSESTGIYGDTYKIFDFKVKPMNPITYDTFSFLNLRKKFVDIDEFQELLDNKGRSIIFADEPKKKVYTNRKGNKKITVFYR